MELQRETTTDCLADIIHIIYLGGKSGTLTVERMQGKMVEEGFILFAAGKITEAKVGQQSDLAAFNYLNTWKTCRFSFIDQVLNGHSSLAPPLPVPLSRRTIPPVNRLDTKARSPAARATPNSQGSNYEGSLALSARPFRLHLGEIAVQHPETVRLARMQRRLLLLVNGQRSISELARLTMRSPEETMALLSELWRGGFIQQ